MMVDSAVGGGAGPGLTVPAQLRSFLVELFNNYGVCRLPFIKQQIELLRKSDTRPPHAILPVRCLCSRCRRSLLSTKGDEGTRQRGHH